MSNLHNLTSVDRMGNATRSSAFQNEMRFLKGLQMAKKRPTAAPSHLRAATARWWQAVIDGYELEEHHIRLLTLAAESWDRTQQAREILAKQGLTFSDRFGQPRTRPEVAIERDSRLAFLRVLRELGLDVEEPDSPRMPAVRGTANLRRGV